VKRSIELRNAIELATSSKDGNQDFEPKVVEVDGSNDFP